MARLGFKLRLLGSVKDRMERELRAGRQAVTSGIKRRTRGLQKGFRTQIGRAGLGKRLANTIHSQVYPKRGYSLGAKGLVWDTSRVGKKRGGGDAIVDLVRTFDEGADIRPGGGRRFLAIPSKAVPKDSRGMRGAKVTLQPSDFPPGSLILLQNKDGGARLVFADRPSVIAFYLVPNARIKPRLNIQALVDKAGAGLDDLITRDWQRRLQRIGAL